MSAMLKPSKGARNRKKNRPKVTLGGGVSAAIKLVFSEATMPATNSTNKYRVFYDSPLIF